MGDVFAAFDETLGRTVAVKVIRSDRVHEEARKRFWREARAAAACNHSNICHVHEAGEQDGQLYIAMELLEGESLEQKLRNGTIAVDEAVGIAVQMLNGLGALHSRGLIHRDLKPSNIFLTPHGVKLLDFGVSREAIANETQSVITQPGLIVGTPAYMAPEQLRGDGATIASDIFAAGAVLYEIIAGRRPFPNLECVFTVDAPPVEPSDLNSIVQKALAKQPAQRYPTAAQMAEALRRFQAERARTSRGIANVKRLIVLPLQILRKDEDTDFLAFSVADAIASSLSGLKSLVVRSTLMAKKFTAEPDVKRIAREADVDYVLAGTLVRFQNDLRITAQLVDANDGSLIRSRIEQVSLGNLFALQDQLVRQIVEDLAVPLTDREERMIVRDVPASAEAYELYLRANQIWLDRYQTVAARDLYRRCVELDPDFAPAWARLGRCYGLIGKYGKGSREALALADTAFRRALELNPDLEAAYGMYAQLEADLGKPSIGMYRILERLRVNPNAPDLYAALVYLLRFCGLLEESLQAHNRAMQLDPNLPTSVTQTCFYIGDYERCLATSNLDMVYIDAMAMVMLGRVDDAISLAKMRMAKPKLPPLFAP
jgi:serine/threonine protein kinase